VRGFELSYKQQYTFLPGSLGGFGAFANYSYTQAQGTFGGTNFTRQLPNLRPRVANLGLSWVGHGAELRIIGNWMGGWYITGAGPTEVYNDDIYKLDFKAQYRFNRNLTVYLDIVNITNEATNAHMRLGTLPYYIKWQGAIYAAGAKWKF
jgi:outer membrane receptor protein involved in Fe transport